MTKDTINLNNLKDTGFDIKIRNTTKISIV